MKYLFAIILVASSLLFGCYTSRPYYYRPNNINVPTVARQGDVAFRAGIPLFASYEGAVAYAPYKRSVVAANYLYNKPIKRQQLPATHLRFMEFGAGLFSSENANVLSLTGWFGAGKVGNQYDLASRSDLSFHRYALLMGMAHRSARAQIDAGMRIGVIRFNKGAVSVTTPPKQLYLIQQIEKQGNIAFAGVGISGAWGFRKMKFICQLETEYSDMDMQVPYEPGGYLDFSSLENFFLKSRASLGLQIALGKKQSKP